MRRSPAVLAIPLLAGLVLAGCGSAKSASATSSATAASAASASGGNANAAVTAAGPFGRAPTVTIPQTKASASLEYKTLVTGTGPRVTSSESFLGNYVAYTWVGSTHKLWGSTYSAGRTPTLFTRPLLPGLSTALAAATIGSRVLAVVPPEEGFGSSGYPQAGVSGTTTLVFVIDVLRAYPGSASAAGRTVAHGGGDLPAVTGPAKAGQAPAVTMPSASVKPPSSLQVQTLVKGSGQKITSGDYVVAQYVGYVWRTGKVFSSTWPQKAPYGFQIGASPQEVLSGWNTGLEGQTVGSRVLLVIPPKDGYGSSGQPKAGITGTDTVVFVVDIIDAYNPSTSSQ
jgi:FKBP-type peptidyl-prolyl cis-trans isomerase